ncbi:hypothetical protein HWD31_gp13 [Pantoea phage vB_PagM_SSEM1]|uniref:Uncharacterized protein n=1 Tax=Pantoea phage vB_PagM_SSEM1 TaxID=2721760 RepID=A0A6H0D9U5_9CAUD|nr:hypothetical protein HWD31_gp13 [Pantoea phage vB_PagM_SSEM1]QIS79360.1 hypothetical protein SSEM1_gp13 [Pantoea phage vB_PagM_SSEM1]
MIVGDSIGRHIVSEILNNIRGIEFASFAEPVWSVVEFVGIICEKAPSPDTSVNHEARTTLRHQVWAYALLKVWRRLYHA